MIDLRPHRHVWRYDVISDMHECVCGLKWQTRDERRQIEAAR